MGVIISGRAVKSYPDIGKQIKINRLDERNIAIGNSAKAKAYDMMIFAFGALLFTWGVMGIDVIVILLFAFVYLFVIGYSIYYRCKFDREM